MIGADEFGAFDHSLQLPERNVARQIFHSAIGRDHQAIYANERKRSSNPRGNNLGRLHLMRGKIEHAEDDGFAAKFLENGTVERRLGRLDGNLIHGRFG
jgi:hypothetical protein